MTEELLLANARLSTKPGLHAITIKASEISSVSSMDETLKNGIHRIDLDGAYLLPGLWDSHLHLEMLTFRLNAIDCETDTKLECIDAVKQASIRSNDDSWLIGFNWNHNIWMPAEYGTAQELDLVSGNHPVLLHAKSLHASWANSRALSLAGIDASTPNPIGAEKFRDVSGGPTGLLFENATKLVERVIPPISSNQLADQMCQTQSYLHSLGVIGIHDFDRFESYEALRQLTLSGERTLEVVKNLPAEAIDQIVSIDYRTELRKIGITPGWVKAFADGALGPQSAAMLEPYENSDNRGMLLIQPEEILELGLKAVKAGWPLSIHAIGDLANKTVLDGFELLRSAEAKNDLPHLKHRVEHVQCLRPDDFKRFQTLDIIASVQPIHFPSDQMMAKRYWGSRCAFAYAYRTLYDAGAELVFGSDAPVETPNPFLGMRAAVDRPVEMTSNFTNKSRSSQTLPLNVALDAYTSGPARIAGINKIGQIIPGHLASLIAVASDPFSLDSQKLGELKPMITLARGKLVYCTV